MDFAIIINYPLIAPYAKVSYKAKAINYIARSSSFMSFDVW